MGCQHETPKGHRKPHAPTFTIANPYTHLPDAAIAAMARLLISGAARLKATHNNPTGGTHDQASGRVHQDVHGRPTRVA
jgi:hypothetical protein